MRMSSPPDLLSASVSLIWIAALIGVLVFHCTHFIHMRGSWRWLHSAHVVMLLGMLYMYAAMAFGVGWFPGSAWMIIYAATSAVIIGWMLVQWVQKGSCGRLWILALVQQGAMIYMWMPMTFWLPLVTYALSAYFALETLTWLTKACVQPWRGGTFVTPRGSWTMPLVRGPPLDDICMMIMAASMGYMFVGS